MMRAAIGGMAAFFIKIMIMILSFQFHICAGLAHTTRFSKEQKGEELMVSVTSRIKAIKQPRGGYLPPKSFEVTEIDSGGEVLGTESENIHSSLVGLAVDYLTRTLLYGRPEDAFKISVRGASLVGEGERALKQAESVRDLRPESIVVACQLAGYDVLYRAGRAGSDYYKPVQDILPDSNTIKNIEIMVNRGLVFFREYGPVVKEGFTFEGGYSETVNAGDGDFVTADTLWDFKVSKQEPASTHTLQLLMYYIMGRRSLHEYLHGIKHLGIFNPRLNRVYTRSVTEIPEEIIKGVAKDVICY